jgi:hypothetical protein
MAQAQRYQFEQRSGGRGAVIRIGPTGGKRLINVYKDQRTAMYMIHILNHYRSQEA